MVVFPFVSQFIGMISRQQRIVLILALIVISPLPNICQRPADDADIIKTLSPALDSIKGERILHHVKVLSSDKFEGRNPGTIGESVTVKYLIEQFRRAGLKPGNPDGTFVQNVPMVGFLSEPQVEIKVGSASIFLDFSNDFVHDIPRPQQIVKAKDSNIVFAGYGIVAPQYGWDDYKGVDVRNKTVIVLSGEPVLPAAAMFKGNLRTYYSTREFKYQIAKSKGAAAILVVTDPTKQQTFSLYQTLAKIEGATLRLRSVGQELALTGLLTINAVRRVFSAAGANFDDQQEAAQSRDFTPFSLGVAADIKIASKIRNFNSKNVIARIEGADPKLKNEYIVYSAHWDHLGKDTRLKGDQIYNGAFDNASGTASMVEMARAFARLNIKPKRSILFIATTGEEKGYLGSRYFVNSHLYPISSLIANINIDGCNVFGLTSDTASTGFGNTTLDEALADAAKLQGRTFQQSSIDNGGAYFASDQVEFAKVGIPAVFPWNGSSYINKPANYSEKVWEQQSKNYHQVSDEANPEWDLSGAVQDAQWLVIAGYNIADTVKRPEWKAGSEFKRR